MNAVFPRYQTRLVKLAVNRYAAFFLFLAAYPAVVQQIGGIPWTMPAWRLEIPLLLYIYFLANQLTQKTRLQPLIAAGPPLVLYGITDAYHIMFGRLPRIIELAEVPELFQILPPLPLALLATALALPMLAFIYSLDLSAGRRFLLLTPIVLLALVVELLPSAFMTAFEETQQEIVFYSDIASVRNNGRLGMMLYYEARRKSTRAMVSEHKIDPAILLDIDKVAADIKEQPLKPNIHLVVLESFLDPRLLHKARFSINPAHPSFVQLFGRKGGFSISPVFAGGTAQAEFELLCGAPALREFSGIEFDVFTGAKTTCLPRILSLAGYETMATNAYKPDFFNSTKAYAGIGFAKKYYPREFASGYDTYFEAGDVTDEDYIFDGMLLAHNLKFITERLMRNPAAPVFNYVIGMYGHIPHDINTQKRPMVVKLLGGYQDEGLEKAANQYYYRTEAIAAYIKGLIAKDPRSLIIVVSDHLPGLSGGETYRDLQYLDGSAEATYRNRIYIIENGRPARQNTINHYDVPKIILNYATMGKYCREHDCSFPARDTLLNATGRSSRDDYLDIMSQAMDAANIMRAIGGKDQCVQP